MSMSSCHALTRNTPHRSHAPIAAVTKRDRVLRVISLGYSCVTWRGDNPSSQPSPPCDECDGPVENMVLALTNSSRPSLHLNVYCEGWSSDKDNMPPFPDQLIWVSFLYSFVGLVNLARIHSPCTQGNNRTSHLHHCHNQDWHI